MSCATTPLVALLVDGELDARSTLEVSAHLETCAECRREQASILSLREGLTRHELPASARARILRSVRPRRVWRAAVSVAALAAALAVGVFAVPRTPSLDDEIIMAHVRSLQVDHLTDVVSTDQHTVKPWFQGKLDFGVPVRDFAPQGFPLVGGRLEYVRGQPAAAVVYRHGAHAINLFVWPDKGAAAPRAEQRRGFNEVCWTGGGLAYWLVSDASAPDLQALAGLIRG